MSRRAGPWWFLGWVGVVSVPFFVLGATQGGVGLGALQLPASAVMVVAPGVVAAGLCWRGGGWPAVRQLVGRLVDRPRPRWRWYALGAGVFAVGAILGQAAAVWSGCGVWDLPLPLAAAPAVVALFVVLELFTNLVLETVLYAGAAGVSQVALLVWCLRTSSNNSSTLYWEKYSRRHS